MNILVCLKLVSSAQFSDTLNDSADRLSGGQLDFNPADRYALELALRLKDKDPKAMVTAVTMAPAYAEHYLRTALAAGADRAVLISDERAAGSDTVVTSGILAAAIKKLPEQDLILCGSKTIDSETGHIGPQLAELLKLPLAVNVLSFYVNGERLDFVCARDGFTAGYSGRLPAVLTVCNGTDMVRSPTIMGIRRSKNAEVLRFDLDALDFPPDEAGLSGSPTKTVKALSVDFRRGRRELCGDLDEGTARLLELLTAGKETAHE